MSEAQLKQNLLKAQRSEITEYTIYKKLAALATGQNRKVLEAIAQEEYDHYTICQSFTKVEVSPHRFKVLFFYTIARLLGLNFGLRLLESNEASTHDLYAMLVNRDPKIAKIFEEKEEHEAELLSLINKQELQYIGSIILGLSDALVELTGVLAGFTFALQQGRLVAIAATITGIAAALSMAASEYLSTKEGGAGNPLQASIYTGITYLVTVVFLIFPYLLFSNPLLCLGMSLGIALILIFIFTFYVSVAKELSFKKRFLEMAGICLGIAILNFFIGSLVKKFVPLDLG